MKITIKNLGIVDFAEIDLSKDLTLFCGPNGTGKTYVAYLLNALFNMKTEVPITVDAEMKENLLLNGIIEIKRDKLRLWAERIESQIKDQLPSIFGISPKEASNMFASTYIKLIVDDNDLDKLIKTELKFFLFHDLDSNPKIINIHKYPESTSIFVGKPDIEVFASSVKNILSEIYSYTFKYILLNNSARMLTVERNSIYTFKTELLANRLETVDNVLIFENEDAGEIVRKRATLYPQAVKNSLKIANELPEIIKVQDCMSTQPTLRRGTNPQW